MQQELLIAILAGLGGMFGWGFADFFAKKTIDAVGDIVSLGWGHVFGTVALFCAVIYRSLSGGAQIALPAEPNIWLFLVFFGALQALVYFLVYKGFGKGQVGVLSPIFASFSGFTAVISISIFGETVGATVLLGLALLFFGILIINIDPKAFIERQIRLLAVPGFREVAAATLLAVVWTLSWDRFIGDQDWLMYAFLMYGFMTLTILIAALINKIDLRVSSSNMWIFLAAIGIAEAVAYGAISIGYGFTQFTSVVALLSGAFSLPTIVLAKIYLKEQITKSQVLGIISTIVGIMLLAAI